MAMSFRFHYNFCSFVGSYLATVGGAAEGMGTTTAGSVHRGGPKHQLLRYIIFPHTRHLLGDSDLFPYTFDLPSNIEILFRFRSILHCKIKAEVEH